LAADVVQYWHVTVVLDRKKRVLDFPGLHALSQKTQHNITAGDDNYYNVIVKTA